MWVSPVLPATGGAAREVVEIVEPIYLKHRFDPLITYSMINERAMVCVTQLAFDTRDAEESARAQTCYTELNDALVATGYIPYRTGPYGYKKLAGHSSVFWDVARQIKNTLDPQGIISPGRYV